MKPEMERIGKWHEITSIQFFNNDDWGYAMSGTDSIGPIKRDLTPRANNKIRGDFNGLPKKEIHNSHSGSV